MLCTHVNMHLSHPHERYGLHDNVILLLTSLVLLSQTLYCTWCHANLIHLTLILCIPVYMYLIVTYIALPIIPHANNFSSSNPLYANPTTSC